MKKLFLALVAMLFAVSVNAENLSASEKIDQLKALAVSYKAKTAEINACKVENPEKAFCLNTDCRKMLHEIDGLIESLMADVDELNAEVARLGNPEEDFLNYDFQKSTSLRRKILEISIFIHDYCEDLFGER